MRLLVATVVILALLPGIAAVDIIEPSSVTLSGSGIINGYIKVGADVSANMQFQVADGYDNVYLDFGEFGSGQVDVTTCPDRVCSVPISFTPREQGSYVILTFSVYDQSGAEQKDLRVRLPVDTIAPRIARVGTETLPNCGVHCAVRPGINTLIVSYIDGTPSIPGSGIQPDTIFVQLPDGQIVNADSCNATQCNISVTIPANSDKAIFTVLASTADAVGNRVGSDNKVTFTVDATPPRVTLVQACNGQFARDCLPTMTGPFELRVIAEDVNAIVAYADVTAFSDLPAGEQNISEMQCSAGGECTLRVSPKIGESRGTIGITVIDSAGNAVQASTEPISVLRSIAEPGDFWQVAPRMQPAVLDKGTAKYFKKTFYLSINPRSRDPDAVIAYTAIDTCVVENEEHELRLPFDDPFIQGATTERPIIVLGLRAVGAGSGTFDELQGELQVSCKVKILSMKNGELYAEPENETVRGKIELANYPLIPEKIGQLQQQSTEKLQKATRNVATLKQTYVLASGMCGGLAGLATTTTSLRGVQYGVSQTGVGDAVAGTPIRTATDSVDRTRQSIADSPIGQPLCFAAMCRGGELFSDGLLYKNPVFGAGFKEFAGDFAEVSTGDEDFNFFDPYKSLFVAYGTACLPAIVHHQQTGLDILCNYDACIQTQVGKGLPVSACEAQKSNLECRYIYGGLFYLSPGAILQTLRDNVLTLMKNPVAAFGFMNTVACNVLKDNYPNALCNLPKHVNNMHKAVATLQSIQAISQTLAQPQGQDACAMAAQRVEEFHANLADTMDCNINYCITRENDVSYTVINGEVYQVTTQPPPRRTRTVQMQTQTPQPTQATTSTQTSGETRVRVPCPRGNNLPECFESVANTDGSTVDGTAASPGVVYQTTSTEEIITDAPTDAEMQFTLSNDGKYYLRKVDGNSEVANRIRDRNTEQCLRTPTGCAANPGTYVDSTYGAYATDARVLLGEYKGTAERLDAAQERAETNYRQMQAGRNNPRDAITAYRRETGQLGDGGLEIGGGNSYGSFCASGTLTAGNCAPLTSEDGRASSEYKAAARDYLQRAKDDASSGLSDADKARLDKEYDGLMKRIYGEEPSESAGEPLPSEIAEQQGLTSADDIDEAIRNSRFMSLAEKGTQNVAKEARKEREKNDEDYQKRLQAYADQEQIRQIRTNTQYALTTAMKTALQLSDITRGLSQFTSQFGLNMPKFIRGYDAEIESGALARNTDLEEHFLDGVCDGRIRQHPYILGLDSRERIGLYLYGTKSKGEVIDTGDEDTSQHEWQYLIGGQVMFAPEKTDDYVIELRGSDTVEIYRGTDSVNFGAASLKEYDSDKEYDKVCIHFVSKDLSDLFETVHSDGRTACVDLVRR